MTPETPPYTITPDWLLRGGHSYLCVYRPDTFETVVTRRFRSVSYSEDVETRVLNTGTLDEVTRSRTLSAEVVSNRAKVALRRWVADGATVRAIGVSARYGPHVIWDDDTPLILTKNNSGLNTLSGDVVLLHSTLYASSVEHSPDLLGTNYGTGWTGSQSRVLPIPGLTVYVYGVGATVEAFDSAGSSLGAATAAGVAFTLPADTWSVTVSASMRSVLVTRPLTATGLQLFSLGDGALMDDAADLLFAI